MTVTAAISAACDYLDAALTGTPAYADVVAEALGPDDVANGMSALLAYLVCDAAAQSGSTPADVIQTMRETYGDPS